MATYARVSSDDQADRGTIATQRQALREALEQQGPVEVVAVIEDDGVSGTIPLGERPGGAQLVALAMAGRLDDVLVQTHDRLGRDEIDLLSVRRRFESLGVRILSLLEGALDETMFGMHAIFAGHGRREFLRRSAAGMDRAVREGRYTGGVVAYGFRVEGKRPDARLVADESEVIPGLTAAGVVRRIYERLAIDDQACWTISNELNALGVPTSYQRLGRRMARRTTSGAWNDGRVRNMVVLTVYKGEVVYGRHSRKPGRQPVTARIPGLVTPELWQAAQDALARHVIAPKHSGQPYLLSGLMTCAHCGTRLVGSMNRGDVWYRCSGSRRGRGRMDGRCFGRDIKGAFIEPLVRQDVERFLRHPGDLLEELDTRSGVDEAAERREAERTAVILGLEKLERELTTYRRMAGSESITEADFLVERDRILADRRRLEDRLAALEPQIRPVAPVEAATADILRERLDAGLTGQQWQEVARCLIDGIEITTVVPEHGPKDATAHIRYRFIADVSTRTRHGSSDLRFVFQDDHPWMTMRCACGAERRVRAFERTWQPDASADERPPVVDRG